MQSICSSIRKEGQFDTETASHSDEYVFYSQVGLYLFRDTKIKMTYKEMYHSLTLTL
jgi:hypothetical protein